MYKFIWDIVKYKIYYELGYTDLAEMARGIRMQAEQLNTVWKKFCQTLACREDLLGTVFAQEMQTLLDNCRPHDSEYTVKLLKEEMPNEQFSTPFTDEYIIGSGTIAQVYRSWHVELNKWVAVKVKHPNINIDIEEALEQYKAISTSVWFPANLVSSGYEFFNRLNQQANFETEFYSCFKMKNALKPSSPTDEEAMECIFIIPEMIKYSPSIIVMTYEPGEYEYPALEDTAVKDHVGVIMMHLQVISLYNGIIHSDLHWGNFSVRLNPLKIVLYDFGWVIDISDKPEELRKEYATAFLYQDVIRIMRLMMEEIKVDNIEYHVEQMQSIINELPVNALTSTKFNHILLYYQKQGCPYDETLLGILYAFVHCDPIEKNSSILPAPEKVHTVLPYVEFRNLSCL